VTFALELLGKLFLPAASLLFWAAHELLKWQIPVVAASELLGVLAPVARTRFLQTPTPFVRA
jgi:hypothetical protein